MSTGFANFFIAQYIPDPFRQEPSNVGVIVECEGRVAAKFFAENEKGHVPKEVAARLVNHPDIYRQWVEFWRTELTHGEKELVAVLQEPKQNFRVVRGGSVSGANGDSASEIATHLFPRIVARGRDARRTARTPVERLETSVRRAFDQFDLMNKSLLVKHPVRHQEAVGGAVAVHVPSFVQENGFLCVMNAVAIGKSATPRAIPDRAGATAHMFNNIREAADSTTRNVSAVAILQVTSQTSDNENVRRLVQILAATSDEVVDWTDERQREKFIAERSEAAKS